MRADDPAPDRRARAWVEQQRVMARCRAGGDASPLSLARPEDLLALIERRAGQMGARLALHKGAERLSYGELDARATGLARAILDRAPGGAEPVALLVDSGPTAVAGMLAAWKAGTFFVSLDATAPAERLAGVLEDSGARLVIADRAHLETARAVVGSRAVALLDAADGERHGGGRVDRTIAPGALACLVYTSGTTGRPKGVMVGFPCLAHRVLVAANSSGTCSRDREAIVRSTAFIGDVGVVFNALASGASAHFLDLRVAGLVGLRDLLAEEAITVLSPGVTLFRQLAAVLRPTDVFPHLRLVRLAGEQVVADDIALVRRYLSPDCIVRVGYSSTETSGIAEFFADGSTPLERPVLPAGFLSPGVDVRIVDAEGREQAVDEPGEIVVRTPGLALGYWRRPEETAARFAPTGAGERCFRTGDVGRWLDDGMLALMGRADAQLKVRGQRVDTAEVEALLRASPRVREAVVAVREDGRGQSWLSAYVVAAGLPPSVTELRSDLARRLPDSAIPQRFVVVDAIPVTLHGKTDWRALPAPSSGRPELETAYVAPRGPMEALVATTWQEMVDVEPVGVRDAFVDLGGDSLRAARVVARLQERLGLGLPVAALLRAGTVEAMAELLVGALADRAPELPR